MQDRKRKGWVADSRGIHREGVWGGGFSDDPMVAKATMLPFYDRTGKGKGVNFHFGTTDAEIGRIGGTIHDLHHDVDIVLLRARERRRRRRMRAVPDPPPNSLRTLTRHALRRKSLGGDRVITILMKNKGLPWDVDAWGRVMDDS